MKYHFVIFARSKGRNITAHAGVAQLVEHNLAKVGVTSSNLATRSKNIKELAHTG